MSVPDWGCSSTQLHGLSGYGNLRLSGVRQPLDYPDHIVQANLKHPVIFIHAVCSGLLGDIEKSVDQGIYSAELGPASS